MPLGGGGGGGGGHQSGHQQQLGTGDLGGGYGLSFASPRSVAGGSRSGLPRPSLEADGSCDAWQIATVQLPPPPPAKSAISLRDATVEHAFAHQKRCIMGLFVRTIGLAFLRAAMVNLAYNF